MVVVLLLLLLLLVVLLLLLLLLLLIWGLASDACGLEAYRFMRGKKAEKR